MSERPPISLSKPWMDERESDRIAKALAGRIGGDGPFGREVEGRLARRLRVRHVLLTTSCTHALELALLALGIGRGDEVIVPSFTFASTANAVLRVGATPVFGDLEEESLALDPSDVARRLTVRTAALLPVHYAGVAGPMGSLLEIAARRCLKVVEDAAQGFDATWKDRALGSIGDAGCLSFHETKNITCGEGGALLLKDDDAARRAEIIREKGTNRAAFLRGEVDQYTWVAEGSSYVLSDVLAAILDAQLDKADEIARRRARVAGRYRAALGDWAADRGVRLPPLPPECTPNNHIFYLRFPSSTSRDGMLDHLRAQGVQASFHYVPLHSSPRGRALASSELPVTDRVAATLLRLPIHPLLSDGEVERVIEAVREGPA
jgi:dTDP-4-amino-4,6-dideoxygalactose transaminase